MERRAKDGTFYRQVGPDSWEPVTRTAKSGEVYKKIGADEWAPIEQPKQAGPTVADKARAAAEGLAESATIGTLPYLKAGAEALTDLAAEKISGAQPDETEFSDRVAKFRQQGKELQAKAPGYAMGGQVAGFFIPGAAASKAVGSGLKVAAKVPGLAKAANAVAGSGKAAELYKAASAAKAAGKAKDAAALLKAARADIALQGARLGAEGAVLGGAYTPESGFSDVGARLEGAATGAATGFAMPAAIRGAGNVVRGAGTVAKAGGKKALSAFGGVSEDVINRYMKDPTRVRNAETFDDLYEQVSGVVKKLSDDFEDKKTTFEKAQKKLDEVARGIKESRISGKEVALEEVKRARMLLDESFKSSKRALADKASPSSLDPLVDDAVGNLKKKISKGSGESYAILDKDPTSYDIRGLSKPLESMADEMNVVGRRITETSEPPAFGSLGGNASKKMAVETVEQGPLMGKGVQAEIRGLAEKIKGLPEEVSAPTLKQIIQDIDASEKALYGQPGFDKRVSQAYKGLRSQIDELIKTKNPEYRAKMSEVADNMGVFSDSVDKFGNGGSRIARLQNIARPSAKYDLKTLEKLAAKEGGQLPQMVKEAVNAQKTLRSPLRLESIKKNLPEQAGVRSAEMQAAVTKRLAKPREITKSIERSADFYKARSAEANMKTAKRIADQFKGFGEKTAEAKLKQVAQGKKFATKTLQELSELADQDFVEAVRAAQDAAAFTKPAFNGSRNVNLWTVIGALGQSAAAKGGAGAGAGFVFGGPVGMAFGAVTGAMLDVYGPAVTKKILDGVLKIQGPITPSALQSLDVPEGVKQQLIAQFKSTILAGRAAATAAETNLPKAAQAPQVPSELDQDSSVPAWHRDWERK